MVNIPLMIFLAFSAGGAGFAAGVWMSRLRQAGQLKELVRERVKLDTLFSSIPDGLVIANLRGQVLFVNPPALDILGIKAEDLKSRGRGMLEPADPDRFRMPVQEILKNHTQNRIMELHSNIYRTTVAMFSAPSGGDFGVLLILRDVTAERQPAVRPQASI